MRVTLAVRICVLAIAAVNLFAADNLQLVIKAQSDFDRVELAANPSIPDAIACVQSEAALLPVAPPAEISEVHYRKAYCTLVDAILTKSPKEFESAAREFDMAVESSPLRAKIPPPVSSGIRVLAEIARLKGGNAPDAKIEAKLKAAIEQPLCPATEMPISFCQSLIDTGKLWLGWISLRNHRLDEAARIFAGAPGWADWAIGMRAFEAKRYAEAVPAYQRAITVWQAPTSAIVQKFRPEPDIPGGLYYLATAQFLNGDYAGVITTLDRELKLTPDNARALFLRARAKDKSGSRDAALADYALAARTAFAEVEKPGAGGEAHLYRGVWLFRRKDFARAEDEFASAMNFEVTPDLKNDARAWRKMAAVAAGACGQSGDLLRRELPSTSGLFPRDEAESLLRGCGSNVLTSEGIWPAASTK